MVEHLSVGYYFVGWVRLLFTERNSEFSINRSYKNMNAKLEGIISVC